VTQARSAFVNSSGISFWHAALIAFPFAGYVMCFSRCALSLLTSENLHALPPACALDDANARPKDTSPAIISVFIGTSQLWRGDDTRTEPWCILRPSTNTMRAN